MNTFARFVLLCRSLSIFAALLCGTAAAQIPGARYAPNFATSDPYSLIDLDGFASAGYPYARFGLLMNEGTLLPDLRVYFAFTNLTRGPFSSANPDLFLLNSAYGSTASLPASFPPSTGWFAEDAGDYSSGNVNIPLGDLPSVAAVLMRKYHFPPTLTNELNGTTLGTSTKKAIILIHGWNPESDDDSYDEPGDDAEFFALSANLKTALVGASDSLPLGKRR